MQATHTHDLVFTDTEVRKRYAGWERGEPDREWACLTLLATYAPGVAPMPVRRETDSSGSPVVVMTRLRGEPTGNTLTAHQTGSLGRALRRTYDVPVEAAVNAGLTERVYGPSTLPPDLVERLAEPGDLSACRDEALVRRGIAAALDWLTDPGALPEPRRTILGVSDRQPANILWDGSTCQLVDFEDGGLSDPAYELADTLEHLAGRRAGTFLVDVLLEAVGLSPETRDRAQAYRPLWAAFWLARLLPAASGFRRNPPGTIEDQAAHLCDLLAPRSQGSGA